MAQWGTIIQVRDVVNGALETARAEKKIGKSLEANIAPHRPRRGRLPGGHGRRGPGRPAHRLPGDRHCGRGHPGRCDQRRRGQVPALLEGAAHGECRRPVPPVRPGAPVPGVNTPSKGPPVPSGPLLWPYCPEKGAFPQAGRRLGKGRRPQFPDRKDTVMPFLLSPLRPLGGGGPGGEVPGAHLHSPCTPRYPSSRGWT